MPIINCPRCGREIDSNSRFCTNCEARICPGCHGFVPPRVVYCPNCGFAVGPAIPGAAEQQPPAPPPPTPRPFPSAQGGIIGSQPQIRPQPSYPPSTSFPGQGAIPGIPIPQAVPSQQYVADDQSAGAYGYPIPSAVSPDDMARRLRYETKMPAGPIPARRPMRGVLFTILIILGLGLLGFAAFNAGWLKADFFGKPLKAVQEFVAGLKGPNWLPLGSKDTTPPKIESVSVSGTTETSVVITWKTDEPATSQVMVCDPGGGCTWTEPDKALVTSHSVSLSALKPNTAYHFTVTSTDAKENQSLAEGDFTTLSPGGATKLLISQVTVANITSSSATISWITDKSATSQVEYGITDAYGSVTPLDEKLVTTHSIILAGLNSNTTYHFRVKSKDAGGGEVTSAGQTFTSQGTALAAAGVGPEVGRRAPDFTLPDLGGNQVSLSQFRGKVVIVKFWADSPTSRSELPIIQNFYKTWSGKEVVILAINWKQTREQAQSFAKEKALTLPILLDGFGEVAKVYGVEPSSPTTSDTTFFMDREGIIREVKKTIRGEGQIEDILKSLKLFP